MAKVGNTDSNIQDPGHRYLRFTTEAAERAEGFWQVRGGNTSGHAGKANLVGQSARRLVHGSTRAARRAGR